MNYQTNTNMRKMKQDENENENEFILKNLVHEHHFTQNLVCTGMLFNVFGFL